jgi:hypothetical protein
MVTDDDLLESSKYSTSVKIEIAQLETKVPRLQVTRNANDQAKLSQQPPHVNIEKIEKNASNVALE